MPGPKGTTEPFLPKVDSEFAVAGLEPDLEMFEETHVTQEWKWESIHGRRENDPCRPAVWVINQEKRHVRHMAHVPSGAYPDERCLRCASPIDAQGISNPRVGEAHIGAAVQERETTYLSLPNLDTQPDQWIPNLLTVGKCG